MGKYFGTDGFRGKANEALTVHHAFKIGRYLGHYYERDKECKVVIGKDTRRSSYMFEYALVAGLTASGADVYLLHVTTTPSVAYVVRTEDFDCGIMISASHNPFDDNGIKIMNERGEKLNEEVTAGIEAYLDKPEDDLPLMTGDKIGRTIDYVQGRNRYIGHLISLATRSYKNMKIGLDVANGSAWQIAKPLFDTLGAKTYVLADDPDGTNINKDCGSTNIQFLQEFVKEKGLNVGFAFDGDADRCFAVDENGDVLDGDKILYVCGKYMKERGRLDTNTIVATVMSNLGLFKALEREGIAYEKTDVGDRFVYENMQQNGHCLGGERSGHVIFQKYASTGDGILTALMLMEVMLEKKQPLSKLAEGMVVYPQYQENILVTSQEEVMADADVQAAVKAIEQTLGDAGRMILRRSGTEPVIRVMVEADTLEHCRKYVKEVVEVVCSKGYALQVDSKLR